jgi:tRNA (guanosine-2'-O-)-methyltransferase
VLSRRTLSLTVVVENLHKPHNMNAILRTCDAFGVQAVHIVPQPGGERIARGVTRGCDKWLTIHFHADLASCFAHLRSEGFRILAASLGGDSRPLAGEDLGGKVALLFGNELEGASPAAAVGADGRFIIPMAGFSQSLNVSVAAGIALHLARKVKEREGLVGDIPAAEAEELRQRWLRLSVRKGEEVERWMEEASPEGPPSSAGQASPPAVESPPDRTKTGGRR